MDANRFTPLQTYKVLKHKDGNNELYECFTPLQTYKVLKPKVSVSTLIIVLHHYKLTRFSNGVTTSQQMIQFYTITNLQGSQTPKRYSVPSHVFYTITNLQGSQTRPRKLSCAGSFTPLQTYKVLKPYIQR